MIKSGFVVLYLLTVGSVGFADTWTLSLVPASGAINGSPGSTVGWGYSIENQSASDWLMATDLGAGSFLNGTPSLLFDFPVLSPASSVTVPFDPGVPAGLYALLWDTDAPSGFVNAGAFTVSAEWWSGDPFDGGSYIADARDLSVPYSATVTSTTPEPRAVILMLLGFVLLICCRFFAPRRSDLYEESRIQIVRRRPESE